MKRSDFLANNLFEMCTRTSDKLAVGKGCHFGRLMHQTHDFFISHSSATKELARQVFYNAISNGISPWYDEALLNLGDHLEEELRVGIESSKSFLLLHSKPALEKKWVPYEMAIAEAIYRKNSKFRLAVIKLDSEPLPEFWEQFLYHSWSNEDQQGSMLRLLSELTGRNPIVQVAAAAVLSAAPSEAFVNSSNTIAEHARNYVFYYLSHVKQLLSAVHDVGHETELRDSIGKVLQLSLFEQLPSLKGALSRLLLEFLNLFFLIECEYLRGFPSEGCLFDIHGKLPLTRRSLVASSS